MKRFRNSDLAEFLIPLLAILPMMGYGCGGKEGDLPQQAHFLVNEWGDFLNQNGNAISDNAVSDIIENLRIGERKVIALPKDIYLEVSIQPRNLENPYFPHEYGELRVTNKSSDVEILRIAPGLDGIKPIIRTERLSEGRSASRGIFDPSGEDWQKLIEVFFVSAAVGISAMVIAGIIRVIVIPLIFATGVVMGLSWIYHWLA